MNALGDIVGEAVLIGQHPSAKRAARWMRSFCDAIEQGQDARPLLVTIGALAIAATVAIDAAAGGRAGLPAPRGMLPDDPAAGGAAPC